MKEKTVYIESLGCAKNQVDSEKMAALLEQHGWSLVDDSENAVCIIINTCGFIESAKKEAIEVLFDAVKQKQSGKCSIVVAAGCLAQRYHEALKDDFTNEEIDVIFGIGDISKIADIVEDAYLNKQPSERVVVPEMTDDTLLDRKVSGFPGAAYLRISDGCSNHCTYCAIPSIRGPFRSRPSESVLAEAQKLASEGVKELVVVAQDTTRYGKDLYGKNALVPLLRALSNVDGIEWIRLLYLYPERIDDALINEIATNEKIVKYMDIPLQHCSKNVLKRMNRHGDRETLTALLNKIRESVPDVTIRTTFIAGFPGETEEEFNELCEFIEKMRFERMGCFAYSEEEGTPAAKLDGMLDSEIRADRADIINERQNVILDEINDSLVGKTLYTIVEGYDSYSDSYFGRTTMDAPEIDTQISFTCGYELDDGDIVEVEIINVVDGELTGEVI